MKTLDQILGELPDETRAAIEARSEELILEEHALRRMRKARKLTQERMAELLGVRQDSISRLERRSDLLLSTLRSYIEAMGGSLQLMVKFDDDHSIALTSLVEEEESACHYRTNLHVRWATSCMTEWYNAEVATSANSNCQATLKIVPLPLGNGIVPHAFGTVIVYRQEPVLGCQWRRAETERTWHGEPADPC